MQHTWPFTVYAVVNALLITWYDFSAPPSERVFFEARDSFVSLIGVLRSMGQTWWAAAAKHKLAEALLKIGDRLRERRRTSLSATATESQELRPPLVTPTSEARPVNNLGSHMSSTDEASGLETAANQSGNDFLRNDADFWDMLGLDFDNDLADGIFSIS